MKERVRRIHGFVEDPVDAVVLFNGAEPHIDRTFFYATGIHGGLFEGCAAILWPDGNLDVLASRLEADLATSQGVDVEVFASREERDQQLQGLLGECTALGVNGKEVTYHNVETLRKAVNGAEIQDVAKAVTRARQVKDERELEAIRRACDIAVEAFDDLLPYLQVGRTESEVAAELGYLMQTKGASGPSFETIVASGPNAAIPHHHTGDRRLQAGDFVLMDFGARYRGYVSDVTRTVVLGRAEKRQRHLYEVVLDAQLAALDAMEAGADGQEVHRTAQGVIDATEFKNRFTHGLGHTIGLSVHDGAGMGSSYGVVLEKNMVMTVEPGAYVPGYGGVRIEDDVRVATDGVEILTPATKEFLEV